MSFGRRMQCNRSSSLWRVLLGKLHAESGQDDVEGSAAFESFTFQGQRASELHNRIGRFAGESWSAAEQLHRGSAAHSLLDVETRPGLCPKRS